MPDNKVCIHYIANYLKLTENWIYHNLPERNYTPVILTRKRINQDLFPTEKVISLNALSVFGYLYNFIIFKILGYFPLFIRKIKFYKAKILHIHFGNQLIKLIPLIKKLNIPVIVSFYGADAFKFPLLVNNKKNLEQIFSMAKKILVLGPYMKTHLINLGCQEEKLIIHHLGIQVNRIKYTPRSLTKGHIRFLLASSFVEKKGIEIVLKALAMLNPKVKFSLDIIGDGPLKEKLFTLAGELNVAEKITFHGYQPYDYFLNLAQECDIFLQASKTTKENDKEGTPMSLVDVMASGMPVISTFHSDIPEIVMDGVTGFLAEENNVEAFYLCISRKNSAQVNR